MTKSHVYLQKPLGETRRLTKHTFGHDILCEQYGDNSSLVYSTFNQKDK